MAYHFSANQYDDQYCPKKLGNWEYPKWYPERPRQRSKPTKFIANNSGRLLDGVKRENPWGKFVATWDLPKRITREYVEKLVAPPERLVNIWGKKRKPQSEVAAEASDASGKRAEGKESFPTLDQSPNSSGQKSFERRNKSCSALDLRPRPTKLEPLVALQEKKENLHDIKPGTLDEKIQKIFEEVKEKEKPASPVICKELKALPRGSKQKTETSYSFGESKEGDEDNKILNGFIDHSNKHGSAAEEEDDEKGREGIVTADGGPQIEEPESETPDSSKMKQGKKSQEQLKKGTSGFQIAKRFHDENLKHKPLPDVVDDPVYKALMSGREAYTGGALSVQPVPSAIGWKPYTTPGPTECSKLKVYRPKTAVDKVKLQKDSRPKTGGFRKRFLPIDLAICWDLKPDDPGDEPKRSPHIDGSNGSAAPAVFSMIHPREESEEEQNIPGSSQAVVERIERGIDEDNVATLPSQIKGKARSPMSAPINREAIMTCVRSPPGNNQKNTPDSINSISTNAAEYARRNPKTAWSNEDTSKALSDRLFSLQKENDKHPNGMKKRYQSDVKKKHHQSTPNLATVCDGSHCGTEKSSSGSSKTSLLSKSRNCGSANAVGNRCGSGSLGGKTDEQIKTQKNGREKNRNCSACDKGSSDSGEPREKTEFKSAFKAGVPKSESSSSGSSGAAKAYKVPKMRLPYAKRSYSIGTLAPPFSFWREKNGQEYPEHWRLASVYQHSFKPLNNRKRPLLASVYQ